jgi:hypothetical protein
MSQHEFWQLAEQSGLMNAQQVALLRGRFAQTKGSEQASARTMVAWLVSERNLSQFQGDMLLARKPGPFIFGDYVVYDKISGGRLSGLLRAVHNKTQQTVCLQFLAGPLAADPVRLATVAHQAAIYNGLTNRHLVRTYHFADLHSHRFMVVENLYGQSLADRLGERKPLAPAEACRLAWHMALGLARLEDAKLTHSELHPSNVWIDRQDVGKLIGFPLHRNPLSEPEPLDLNRSNDPNSRISRLADYLAPEVPRGGALTNRAEVYALGCLLYEMLTGQVPFPAGHTFQKIQRHLGEPVVPPNQINPQVPGPVAQLVLYMMAKDPTQRYQKAAHVAEALKPYLEPGKLVVPDEPATPQKHNYEQWLAQYHPAGGVDPDTGEFRVPAGGGAFMRDLARAQMTPSFDAPNAGSTPVVAGSPQAIAQAAATPQIVLRTETPAIAATTTPSTTVGKKSKEQQMLQYMVVGIGTFLALMLALIVMNNLSAPTPSPTDPPPQVADNTPPANPGTSPANPTPGLNPSNVSPTQPNPRTNPGNGGTGTTNPGTTPPAGGNPFDQMYEPEEPLWAWPVAGQKERLDLRGMPNSVQMIVSLRLAELLSTTQGEQVWACLGPWAGMVRGQIEGLVGTPLENIEHVNIGFLDNGVNPPMICLVARPRSPVVQSVLTTAWGNPTAGSIAGQSIFTGNGRVYALANRGGQQTIIVAPEAFAEEVVSTEPPLIRAQMEQLAADADARLHCNVLFAPNFVLFSAGQHIFTGPARRLKDPIDEALKIDGVKPALAGLLSVHLSPDVFFTELRLHPGNDGSGITYSRRMYDLFQGIPQRVYQFMAPPSEGVYGFIPSLPNRQVLARYPKMLSAWMAYLRRGSDERVAILSSVLPAKAAHNIVLATQLAVRDAGVDIGTAPAGPTFRNLAEKLKGITFPTYAVNDELQRIVQALGEEHEFKVQVMGGDLQMNGITQNQRVILDLKEKKTLEELLQQIVFVANPIKTTTKLSDDTQQLVYVIGPDNETIIITTRIKAKERGTAPAVFGIQ